MVLWLLMGFLADLIFGSASARSRAYEAEVDRYLAERGYSRPRPKNARP